jgi:hypothetical protein
LGTPERSSKRININRLLAWFFAVLFILSTIGVIFTFFPTRKLLSPDFYKQALEDVRIYQRLPESIAQQLALNFTQNSEGSRLIENPPVYLLILDQEEWESILIDLIDPTSLQTQTENILDQFFNILLISPDPVNTPIEVSLLDVKNRLGGPEGIQAFNQILNAQDPCSIDQLMGLLQLGLGMETSIDSLLCRPPDYIISELNPVVETFLSAAVAQVPDQLSINLPLSVLDSSLDVNSANLAQGEIPAPIKTLRRTNTIISWSLVLPLLLIILMTIFAVRSLRDFLRWWGGTFLTAGLISLILSLFLFPIASWGFSSFVPSEFSSNHGLIVFLVQMGIGDLSRELTDVLIMSVVIPASVLATIGFALLLGSYLLTKSSPPNNVQLIESANPMSDTADG